MEKIKVFISQPMKDRTNEEIENERKEIIAILNESMAKMVTKSSIASSRMSHTMQSHYGFQENRSNYYPTADVAVFVKGWNNARGCVMEHLACENYKIAIWEI